jgi:hypothetical protein
MERIAQYLSGRLSAQERADFEAEAAGDPLLQEQLDFQRDITHIMQRRALRTEISTVAKQYGAGSGFSWMAMTVTGVVVAAGIAGFLLFSSGKEPQKPQATTEQVKNTPGTESRTETPAVSEQPEIEAPELVLRPFPIEWPFIKEEEPGFFGITQQVFELDSPAETQLMSGYAMADNFDQLDFLPEGFRSEALAQIPVEERSKWDNKRLSELYYSLGNSGTQATEDAVKNAGNGYITVRSWRKPMRMHIPGTLNKRSDYKGNAFGLVVDDKGDGLANVTVEFLAYGDKKKVTTDANGRFAFELYGKIATEAKFTVPGYGETSIPKALFQSGKQSWFQVETSGMMNTTISDGKIKVSEPKSAQPSHAAGEHKVADGSCSVSPAALKALRSPEFLGTYIATKEFERRIKALHMLENGQQLLDVYVDNLMQPLWKVDQLVADRLTGESKKLFEGFSAERSGLQQDLSKQSYYSDIYRKKRDACRQAAALNQSDDMKKLVEHMTEFVAPCTR